VTERAEFVRCEQDGHVVTIKINRPQRNLKAAFKLEAPERFAPQELAAHDRGKRQGVLGPSRWTDIYGPLVINARPEPSRTSWCGVAHDAREGSGP